MRKNIEEEQLRTIPITNGFMMKKVNDLLYSYLQCKSHIDSDKKRFCYPSFINYSDLAKKFGGAFSKSKLHRDMSVLIELGFVGKGTVIDLYGEETKVFLLPFETKNNIYKFIPLETLQFMMENLPPHSIQIYSYLLNRFDGFGSRYTFTKRELINQLGVKNPKQSDYDLINNILQRLIKSGLIEYAYFYQTYENGVTPKHRLLKVNNYYMMSNVEENSLTNEAVENKEIESVQNNNDRQESELVCIDINSVLSDCIECEKHKVEECYVNSNEVWSYGEYSKKFEYSLI